MDVENTLKLYWVAVSGDPSEDWFVFASQAHLAQEFFAGYEGLEACETEVRMIEENVRLQTLGRAQAPRWAKLADLEALGFAVLSRTPHLRVVRKGGETFAEGYLQSQIVEARDDLSEADGKGLPNGTRRRGRPN